MYALSTNTCQQDYPSLSLTSLPQMTWSLLYLFYFMYIYILYRETAKVHGGTAWSFTHKPYPNLQWRNKMHNTSMQWDIITIEHNVQSFICHAANLCLITSPHLAYTVCPINLSFFNRSDCCWFTLDEGLFALVFQSPEAILHSKGRVWHN